VGRDPGLTWLELATLVAIAGWNLCTYAWVWMAVTPGLSFWRAMAMTQATTAVANTIPAGVGARAASAGFPLKGRDLTLVLAHAMASRLRVGYRLAGSERA
jgi:uncharacterized membrane protein YbhN (UPF0104 family)